MKRRRASAAVVEANRIPAEQSRAEQSRADRPNIRIELRIMKNKDA
jgi:hypothetical protein